MSRWVENFESHQFHIDLENYKIDLDSFNVKKISDLAIVNEIGRLKKILKFIESFLKIIDPELNIENCLGAAHSHLNNSVNYYNQFKSNPVLPNITQANAYIDNCVAAVNLLNIKLVRLNGSSISSVLSAYQDTIADSFERIDLENTTQASEQIRNLEKELLEDEEEQESIKTRITNLLENIETRSSEVDKFYSNTFVDGDDEEVELSTKTLIHNSKKHVIGEVDALNKKILGVNQEIKDLEKFHLKVFGKYDDENEKKIGGLQKELDDKLAGLGDLEIKQAKVYSALEEEITSLLPHATSAGLASKFNEQRKKFSMPIIIWNGVFITTLFLMFSITLLNFVDFPFLDLKTSFKLENPESILETLNVFLIRLPLYAPLVWLAIYSGKRRSENLRLEQEYVHKETLAGSFSSYKKQIEDLQLKDTSLSEKLLDSSISTLSNNASESLNTRNHKQETPLTEVVEGLGKAAQTLKDTIKLSK